MSMDSVRKRGSAALASMEMTSGTPRPVQRGPITSPGAMAMMQPTIDHLTQKAAAAEQALAEMQARLQDNPTELPFDQIVEVEGRRRQLTPDEFEELRANLAANPQVHPFVVRPLPGRRLPDGRQLYELISGYNRLDIQRLLGRTRGKVSILPLEDDGAEDAAFWSNLLQPAMPDYAKFLGLKAVQLRHNLRQADLAKRAGISKSQVTLLFSFEDLPQAVTEILRDQPHIMGAATATHLVRLLKANADAEPNVVQAVQKLSEGAVDQKGAVEMAQSPSTVAPRRQPEGRAVRANTIQIRHGQTDFCRVVTRGTSLRVEFKSPEHRALADQAIQEVLQQLAATAGEDSAKAPAPVGRRPFRATSPSAAAPATSVRRTK